MQTLTLNCTVSLMFEPSWIEVIALAVITAISFVQLIKRVPRIEHYTNGGHYEPTKFEAVKGYRYDPAPVRNNPVQAWYWEGDLHE